MRRRSRRDSRALALASAATAIQVLERRTGSLQGVPALRLATKTDRRASPDSASSTGARPGSRPRRHCIRDLRQRRRARELDLGASLNCPLQTPYASSAAADLPLNTRLTRAPTRTSSSALAASHMVDQSPRLSIMAARSCTASTGRMYAAEWCWRPTARSRPPARCIGGGEPAGDGWTPTSATVPVDALAADGDDEVVAWTGPTRTAPALPDRVGEA